jgi:hypothetical protein
VIAIRGFFGDVHQFRVSGEECDSLTIFFKEDCVCFLVHVPEASSIFNGIWIVL